MIAMALVNRPDVLFADEPTTALDVTVQAQILDTLLELRSEMGLAIVLVTHDLGVVAGTADRVQVMYAGQAVESGAVRTIFRTPRMPYTVGLLAALPRPGGAGDVRLSPIPGAPPSLVHLPDGCAFAARCPLVTAECRLVAPPLAPVPGDDRHEAACHHQSQLAGLGDPRSLFRAVAR